MMSLSTVSVCCWVERIRERRKREREREREREKKKKAQKIDHGEENFPPLLPGLEPAIFRSGVRRSITGLSPLPMSEELPPAVFDE